MSNIQYTTIVDKNCCGGEPVYYDIPIGSTPHEIATIIGSSIEKAIELFNTQIAESEDCPTIYLNVEINEQVQKECLNGNGTFVNVVVPAGMFSSQLSQNDADEKAKDYFDSISQSIANELGECPAADCTNCEEYRVLSTSVCGERRINTKCTEFGCVDTGSDYFVCTGNCDGEVCIDDCIDCSYVCPEGGCPDGYTCVNGVCLFDCDSSFCSLVCKERPCEDPCQICVKGICTDIVCDNGQTCVGGSCIDNDCVPECSYRIVDSYQCYEIRKPQTCFRGSCIDSELDEYTVFINEGLPCDDGVCRSGVCVQNLNSCIPPCVENEWEIDSERPCYFSRIRVECIDNVCTELEKEYKIRPDGSECPGGNCLSGNCVQDCLGEGGGSCPDMGCCEGLVCVEKVCVKPPCSQIKTELKSSFKLKPILINTGNFELRRTDGGDFTIDFPSTVYEPVSIYICTLIKDYRIVNTNFSSIQSDKLVFSGTQNLPPEAYTGLLTVAIEWKETVSSVANVFKYGDDLCCIEDIYINPER